MGDRASKKKANVTDQKPMQAAAGLLAAFGDSIEVIKSHLATMGRSELDALLAVLPSRSPAGSAEMVMRILVYREIEKRRDGTPLH